MNDTKHTPGTWRIGDAGHTVFGPPNGTPSPETIANVRKRSNARLIRSAPELLEALKTLVEHAQEKYPHFESERGQRNIAQALSAIANAEGKQS